jgi:putative transposase
MRRTFQYRIYPTKEQSEKLTHSLDLLRDIYNAALQERRDAWRMNRVRVSYFDQSKQIPDIRRLNTDYLAVPARSIAQTLRQLDRAFAAFFRRVKSGQAPGFPRFKGKTFFNSIVYNREGYKIVGNRLHLSKIGAIKLRLSRPVIGTVKEVQIKREGEKWFACVSCDNVPENPLQSTGETIGIDVGIESFATLSDGTQIDNWKYYESSAKQLRKAQRRVARRHIKDRTDDEKPSPSASHSPKDFQSAIRFPTQDFDASDSNYDLIAVENLTSRDWREVACPNRFLMQAGVVSPTN